MQLPTSGRQQQLGLCIVARRTSSAIGTPNVLVPAPVIFASLVRLPESDLAALGYGGGPDDNHPCNAVLSVLPVLPPVSRPAMRTTNLKTGNPFVVEIRAPMCLRTVRPSATRSPPSTKPS